MGLIHRAVVDYTLRTNEARQVAREGDLAALEPRLSVSSIGKCPRRAFYDAFSMFPDHPFHAYVTRPFDVYTVTVLEAGYIYEEATKKALEAQFGERVACQVRVENRVWRGHIDFLLDNHIVIDNKGTNPRNFAAKRLPYLHHCKQVLMYRRLLMEQGQDEVRALLYYRCWDNWAEFEIYESPEAIIWEGEVNGEWTMGEQPNTLEQELALLQWHWDSFTLPERMASPLGGWDCCLRLHQGYAYPSCPYLDTCWPELDGIRLPAYRKEVEERCLTMESTA